jgi:hypothetical protein
MSVKFIKSNQCSVEPSPTPTIPIFFDLIRSNLISPNLDCKVSAATRPAVTPPTIARFLIHQRTSDERLKRWYFQKRVA